MAEAVGIVIGGVSMLTKFGTCMDGLNRIRIALEHNEDVAFYELQLELLKHRFATWGMSVGVSGGRSEKGATMQGSSQSRPAILLSQNEQTLVWDILGRMSVRLSDVDHRMEKQQQRIRFKRNGGKARDSAPPVASSQMVPGQVQDLDSIRTAQELLAMLHDRRAATVKRPSGLNQKIRWALGGRDEIDRLFNQLKELMDELERLSPSSVLAGSTDQELYWSRARSFGEIKQL